MSNQTAAITPPTWPLDVRAGFRQARAVGGIRALAPQVQWKNPVMFVCYIGAILTTGLGIQAIVGQGEAPATSSRYRCGCGSRCCSRTSEAVAEGRGKARRRRCARRARTSPRRS